MLDLREAAIVTTYVDRVRMLAVTATLCLVVIIGSVMSLSWLFAGPPSPPETCGHAGVYRVIVDPKQDNVPYVTIICRDGKTWFEDPNL